MAKDRGGLIVADTIPRHKLRALLQSDPDMLSPIRHTDHGDAGDSAESPGDYYGGSARRSLGARPPYLPSPASSPWNNAFASPYTKSPWVVRASPINPFDEYNRPRNGLIGSIVREEGHVYSLATSGDLLYTGSDSKNIRVWKNLKEVSGFKSSSGLVKAMVISGDRIFSGHQDGKIRVWKSSSSSRNSTAYRRITKLPTSQDLFVTSVNPKNYVWHHRSLLHIRHNDAVSCLSLNEEQGLLYSGSWDKTVKVWRVSDYKCLESIAAHDDAVNSIVTGFKEYVFTGSADGTVKVWRREAQKKHSRHFLMQLLMAQLSAVTALAVNQAAATVYCGTSDGLVNFWEMEKERLSHGGVLRGHKLAVLCLASAGRLVVSGSADKTVCLWRSDGGGAHSCLTVLAGHCGPVKCLAMAEDTADEPAKPDGDRRWILYSGSLDKSVKVWRVSEGALE